MTPKNMPRRDFLASCLAGIPVVALDWESFPKGKPDAPSKGSGPAFDAVHRRRKAHPFQQRKDKE